jgi:Zn-dependent protease with chaperone function
VLRAEAAGLLVLAIVLAVPVPAALGRARWPARDPRVAIVCWQAVGLAGGLSLLGATLTLAASSLSGRWLPAISSLRHSWSRLGISGWTGMALAALIGIWLAVTAVRSTVRVVLARRQHRVRLDAVADDSSSRQIERSRPLPRSTSVLVSTHLPSTGELRLLDSPTAIAYCLPGLRPRIVVSQGTVAALDPAEFDAVLAHEQVHARGRHDLLVQPFIAWRQTFPFLPTAATALGAVELLIEMLADDGACRQCDPVSLGSALRRLGDEHLLLGSANTSEVKLELDQRITRLSTPVRSLALVTRITLYLAAVALVLLPPVMLVLT